MDAEQAAAEGAGVATAGVVGTAAGLVEMAARVSEDWPEARAAVGQALALRRRAEGLAVENVRRYADVLRALDHPSEIDLGAALSHTADIPLRIAETVHSHLGYHPGRVYLLRARSIPRTSNGKIQYEGLKRAYLDGSLRADDAILYPDF